MECFYEHGNDSSRHKILGFSSSAVQLSTYQFLAVSNMKYVHIFCVRNSEFVEIEWTASVFRWSEFLAANPEVADSIPDAARFSE
jgi:hypothetical protein